MNPKRVLLYIWLPISALLNAISLINLQKDLLPALRSWSQFAEFVFAQYSEYRDALLYPAIEGLKLINISFPDGVRSYLLLGLIFFGTFAISARLSQSESNIRELTDPLNWVFAAVFFPIMFFIMVSDAKREDEKRLRRLFFWSLLFIAIALLVLMFVDFLLKKAA